jgi:FtsP/CotA-like multicopper oxidase with cupredoxin domain
MKMEDNMNKRNLIIVGFILAVFALAAVFYQGQALAAGSYVPPNANVPICNVAPPGITPADGSCTDYFGVANWALSPLPAGTITGFVVTAGGSGYTAPNVIVTDPVCTATAAAVLTGGIVTGVTLSGGGSGCIAPQVMITDTTGTGALAIATIGAPFTAGTGIRKFQDTLPGLCGVSTNNLGQCISVGTPDTATFNGSDYYSIGVRDYYLKMHTDLPGVFPPSSANTTGTHLRGYVQLDAGGVPVGPNQYLGPFIVAVKDRPVRIKFTNMLGIGSAGDLMIPTDTTYMGAGNGPDGSPYTQNRATLHLHGGRTPWISDGTPHQWITPAGESTTTFLKGDSFQNVSDMVGPTSPIGMTNPNPSDGQGTFYWTNQQSGRLMFYHDHAYGLTRLNVYAGEAAGYLIVDPVEETSLKAATLPGTIPNVTAAGAADLATADLMHLVPLVIQDKTFVPTAAQLLAEDPTWKTNLYGSNGNLWFPHVYMTNQDPNDPMGMNAYGRWDYGAWFWPFMTSLTAATPNTAVTIPCSSTSYPGQTIQCPIIRNPSGTPEAFMDTPLVNGTAYPVLHVAPAAYRFRILSAGNDRTLNLGLYYAATASSTVPGTVCKGAATPSSSCTEVNMLAAAPPAATSALPLCAAATKITNPAAGIGLAQAALDAAGNPINSTGLPLNCWPTTWPTDGRDGGVPDPTTAGPPIIQIGTEGGLLPKPVVIPSTPTSYEYMRRSITVLNISTHGLLIGPAERADVVVDFSSVPAGSTIILYNDAPAPVPAFDARTDYYTGTPDQTGSGGSPSTQPGYGPNTRTIMQIVVDQTAPNTVPFSLPTLTNAFKSTASTQGIYAVSQPGPIVPEAALNSAYNAAYTNTYSRIQDYSLTFFNGGPLPGIVVTAGGSGYSASPNVAISAPVCTPGPACVAATASATVVGGVITGITLTNAGNGYTSAPTINITDATGTGALATATQVMKSKAIQELFTVDYGRMNATLGVELPFTNFNTQTTIPLGYIDPPTEQVKEADTQLWRITHNGVDTHFIHFHLFDVQVINRVGWDGVVKPAEENEVGWKDTVRMNPLEDIVVALKPARPVVPFPLPDSIRLLDVTMPPNTTGQFTGIDPLTNGPITVTNQMTNFGWEYVWHCHILGHEENDMMRPVVFQIPPEAPSNLLAVSATSGANLTWTDNSASASQTAAPGSGFTLQRATDGLFTLNVQNFPVAASASTGAGSTVTYLDATVAALTQYFYRVQAYTPNGISAWSNIASLTPAPIASITPATLTFAGQLLNTTSAAQSVTLSNTGSTALTINSIVFAGTNPGDFAQTTTCPIGGAGLAAGANCTISVTFTPAATGSRTASMTINSNDPVNSVLAVSLIGTGTAVTSTAINAPAITYGQNGLITVSVTSPQVTPVAGTVTLVVDGGAPLSGTLVSGSVSFTLTTPAAGPHTLSANYAAQGGFGASSATGTLTVNGAPLVITASSSAMTFGGTVPVITPAFNAFVLGQTNLTGLTAQPVCSTTATTASPVGPYPSSCSGAIGSNYLITYVAGTVTINPATTATAILSNTPNPSILGQLVKVSYSVAPQFSGTPSGSVTVTASTGETCTGTLTAGAGNCSLIFNTGGARTLIATYAGNANFLGSTSAAANQMVSSLTLSTTSLLFGNQTVGTTSAAQAVTISNVGPAAIAISSIVASANFIDTTTCGANLAAGTSCRINVRFAPATTGVLTGTLTITDSNPISPQIVTLTGTGVAPVASVSPASLAFGNQARNTTSAAQPVTLTNTGTTALIISSITLGGTNPTQFSQTNTCPIGGAGLAAGANCTISVRFSPTGTGARTATLSISDNAAGSPQTVTLTGTGTAPVATVSPTSLAFGTQLRNTTSAARTVTLSNRGTGPMVINGITLGGANPTQFSQTNTCPIGGAGLAAGTSCTISVRFRPTGAGTRTATLSISDNATGSPQSVTLIGTGL